MFESSTLKGMLGRQLLEDRIRDAEAHRLAQRALAGRGMARTRGTTILVRASQALQAAYRTYVRPSVSPAG